MKIIDRFIGDQKVIDKLYEYLLFGVPHELKEKSSYENLNKLNIENCFYSSDFDLTNHTINALYENILNTLEIHRDDYYPFRIHTNIQYQGMGIESKYHIDDVDLTIVYFLSPNIDGGEYEFLLNGVIQKVDYVQDRLLIFNGEIMHKAYPPSNNQPRISLAFKLKRHDKNVSP